MAKKWKMVRLTEETCEKLRSVSGESYDKSVNMLLSAPERKIRSADSNRSVDSAVKKRKVPPPPPLQTTPSPKPPAVMTKPNCFGKYSDMSALCVDCGKVRKKIHEDCKFQVGL